MNKRQYKKKLKGRLWEGVIIRTPIMNFCTKINCSVQDYFTIFNYLYTNRKYLKGEGRELFNTLISPLYNNMTRLPHSKKMNKIRKQVYKHTHKSNLQGEIK